MRNNAKDANVPRRIDGPGEPAVPAASAASSTASAPDRDVPGWLGDAGWLDLSGSAAATAATAGAQVRRARINFRAGANGAGPFTLVALLRRNRDYFVAVLRTNFALNSFTSALNASISARLAGVASSPSLGSFTSSAWLAESL